MTAAAAQSVTDAAVAQRDACMPQVAGPCGAPRSCERHNRQPANSQGRVPGHLRRAGSLGWGSSAKGLMGSTTTTLRAISSCG